MSGTTILLTPTAAPAAGLVSATHVPRLTCQDVVDQLLDYLGSDVASESVRQAKEALLSAYSEMINAAHWTYYQAHGRVFLNAPYSTGDIAYDHTGGTYERMVTLTDGTWPEWAGYGSLRVGAFTWDIQRRISDTVVTLDVQINPGVDVDAETTYSLFRDTYTLPEDFQASEAQFDELILGRLAYLAPAEWLAAVRRSDFSGLPTGYTIRGDPRRPGRLAVSLVPYPASATTLDFAYQRLARRITTLAYSTGTVTVSAGLSGTTTVTGSGTAWRAAMQGSVLRISANATDLPQRLAGENPYAVEVGVISVDSATQLTVDESILDDYSAVKYLISDPIDIELGAMSIAFQRCCEKQLAITRDLKKLVMATTAYNDALIAAREGDARDFGVRSAGRRGTWTDPIRSPYGRTGADIS